MGFEVLGLDIRPPQDIGIGSSSPSVLNGDITRPETLPSRIRKAAILVHCAALVHRKSADLSRSNYFRVNLEGTRNILRALDADYLRKIIFLSTVSVYGITDPGQAIDEETPPMPQNPYGESKLAAEREVQAFSHNRDISYTIFRLAPVYGRDFRLNIDKRVYLPKRAAFYKIGDGTQRISMCAVGNVASAVSQGLEVEGGFNGVFNLKDTEDYSMNEIIAVMRKLDRHFHRPVLRIPKEPLVSCASRVVSRRPGRGIQLGYQVSKVALGAVYSGEKLLGAGIRLPWNLSSEMLGESRS